MTNIGEFQHLVYSSICWASSCSWTRYSNAYTFVLGHCLIQIGCSNTFILRLLEFPPHKVRESAFVVSCLWKTWTIMTVLDKIFNIFTWNIFYFMLDPEVVGMVIHPSCCYNRALAHKFMLYQLHMASFSWLFFSPYKLKPFYILFYLG